MLTNYCFEKKNSTVSMIRTQNFIQQYASNPRNYIFAGCSLFRRDKQLIDIPLILMCLVLTKCVLTDF